jgi:UDP-GlcNAc:undecaprenyl-phosphate GlcNAc-1-phosphate transferase
MLDIIFFIFYFSTIILFLTYYKIISQRLKLIDKPGVKKIHKKPTPLMGGIIIFVLFIELLTYQYSIYLKNLDTQILIAISGLCFFIGIVDDRINIKSYLKLFIIFLAVLFLLYFSNKLILQEIYFKSFNIVLNLNKYGVYFTTLCILLLINAFNLSDGINGLAIIISIHWILALFFFTFNVNITHLFLPLFTLIIIGFFVYKEKFFLGDSGSLFISSLIGLMTIYLYNFKLKSNYTDLSVENFFLIFIIPGLDMLRLFVERIFNKRDPFSGDKKHLHHLLIKYGLKTNKILTIFFLLILTPILINVFTNIEQIILIIFFVSFYFILFFYLKRKLSI